MNSEKHLPPLISETSAPEPIQLFMCEIPRLTLHENQLYIFQKAPGCADCEQYLTSAPLSAQVEGQTKALDGKEADVNAVAATRQNDFILIFNQLAREVYENAKTKGWWDVERNDGEMIALMHSELSEALEAIRNGNPPDDKIPEYLGTEAELADVIIRIMDMAHARRWRVGEAVIVKMEMNKGRPYKHGRKAF